MYVRIYAETGIIGMNLYTILYAIMMGKMLLISWKLRKPKLRALANALICGIFGVMAANYSAESSIALPSSMVLLWSYAIIWMTQKWDNDEEYPDFGVVKRPSKLFPK